MRHKRTLRYGRLRGLEMIDKPTESKEMSSAISPPISPPISLDPGLTERVLRVVAANQKLVADKVTIDSTFEQLGMDSLDGVNLVFAIEEEFDLSIPDEAAKSIRSVRQMAEGVAQLLEQKTGNGAKA